MNYTENQPNVTRAIKKRHGFTIVELLIVIVVIAILASITIVAYNGIQQRARASQTSAALTAWVKAIKLYRADKGAWPTGWVCLGTGYKYGPSGSDTSGVAQCRQDTSGSGMTENTAFNTSMQPYVGASMPTPAMVTGYLNDNQWRRGLSYAYGGGDGTLNYIFATFDGDITCPGISGTESSSKTLWGGNTNCLYTIGHTYDQI